MTDFLSHIIFPFFSLIFTMRLVKESCADANIRGKFIVATKSCVHL